MWDSRYMFGQLASLGAAPWAGAAGAVAVESLVLESLVVELDPSVVVVVLESDVCAYATAE